MSGEIEVPETPNWLQELEAKRERRLKARLGHETGAGAPCLKCGDKCPGLDLHFWRKCCKICKCSKEEHEVQDDDIYGWAQFQLLGSKPNKIKRKIILPGKKDAVELDWAPKGHKETVDKYLKTLPPEQLPVKGSQAAQDRKQLLQKQIPIHDIDPTLCHELTEEELKQMNDYVTHVKQTSVGIGQIVSLSSLIKANLHTLNPSEAAIIASRYAKGIPLSEIVKLHSQSRASLLKPHGLSQNLEKLSLNDPHSKSLPTYVPTSINTVEESLNPSVTNKVHDVNYPGYTRDINQTLPNVQFSSGLNPEPIKGFIRDSQSNQPTFDPTIDEKYLQNPNFDPKSTPSHFVTQTTPYSQAYAGQGDQTNVPYEENFPGYKLGDGTGQINSAFVPYSKVSSGLRPGENYIEENPPRGANYSSGLPERGKNISSGFKSGDVTGENVPHVPGSYRPDHNYTEDVNSQLPGYAKSVSPNINKGSSLGDKIASGNIPAGSSSGYIPSKAVGRGLSPQLPKSGSGRDNTSYETAEDIRNRNIQGLPNYAPGKFTVQSEVQSPTKVPRSVRDLAFSTYDQSGVNPEELEYNFDPRYPQNLKGNNPGQLNVPYGNYSGFRPEQSAAIGKENIGVVAFGTDVPSEELESSQYGVANDDYLSGFRPVNAGMTDKYPYGHQSPSKISASHAGSADDKYPYGQNAPYDQSPNKMFALKAGGANNKYPYSQNAPYDQTPSKVAASNPGDADNKYPYSRNSPYDQNPRQTLAGDTDDKYPYSHITPYDQSPSKIPPSQRGVPTKYPAGNIGGVNKNHPGGDQLGQPWGNLHDPNVGSQQNVAYENCPTGFGPGSNNTVVGSSYPGENIPGQFDQEKVLGSKPGKKLSELHPGKININEDFLLPSQVKIGAIQDINYPEIKAATQGTNDFYEDYSPDSLKEILNNIILPDCHYCKKPFEENEFAVTIDRANVLFHAECFKCAGCNQILADNVYFYNKETDNIYCGRDYAKIRGFPRCKACDELIFTKEYCLAENSTFHLKHFCCMECDKPLAGQDYILEEEMPYCLPCFEQNKASKCSSCCRVIKPDEIGCNLNGVHFHASDECFACKMCKKPLMGKKLLLRNEKLYCSHDCYGADK